MVTSSTLFTNPGPSSGDEKRAIRGTCYAESIDHPAAVPLASTPPRTHDYRRERRPLAFIGNGAKRSHGFRLQLKSSVRQDESRGRQRGHRTSFTGRSVAAILRRPARRFFVIGRKTQVKALVSLIEPDPVYDTRFCKGSASQEFTMRTSKVF